MAAVLAEEYPDGVDLVWAYGISADGRTIVGSARDTDAVTNTSGAAGFVVTFEDPSTSADLNGDGSVNVFDLLEYFSRYRAGT